MRHERPPRGKEERTRRGITATAAVAMFAAALVAVQSDAAPASSSHERATAAEGTTDAEVARGAYLARLGDCAACHSVPGTPAFSGGYPLNTPLGVIYSTNITPDPATGIGAYTLEDFDRAVRRGVTPRHRLYPAMPFPSYAKVSADDVRALYAYFMKAVTPVRREPPQTRLPFPFNQRWGLALWDLVFLDRHPYSARPDRDASWNRGAYLVQGLGHCGSCHTPRGIAYQERGYDERSAHFLTGGISEHWFAPNLTGDAASGLGRWGRADVVRFLKSGHGAGSMAFGPMKQVVSDSTQHVDDADVDSIAVYLKSLPSRAASGAYRPDSARARRSLAWLANGEVHVPGDGIFMNFCARCHEADGRGNPRKAPALAGSAVVLSPNPASVIAIILEGGEPHRPAGSAPIDPMPGFAEHLNDREVAEVASFLRRTWGNDARPIATRTVTLLRKASSKEEKPPQKR